MAEVFQKPKPFSKEWFRYIWCYYKVHILVVLAVLVLGGITIHEQRNTISYDAQVHFVANKVFSQQSADTISAVLSDLTEDVNGDGERHGVLAQLNYTPEAMADVNQVIALENKLMTVLVSDTDMLFIFDDTMLGDVLRMDATEGLFLPVSQWAGVDVTDERLYFHEGVAYGVSLKGSRVFQDMGIASDDLFVAIKQNSNAEDLLPFLQNSVNLANRLIEQ